MKRFLMILALAPLLASAQSLRGPLAELLTVRADGTLYPSNAVATITTLANVAAGAQAAVAEAQAIAVTAATITNSLAEIRALENARNSTGYIRLFVESFSPGIEADTNLTASIVLFSHASNSVDYAFYDLWTYFTSSPGTWPYVRTSESAGRTNAWDMIESENVSLGEVLVGSTLYEAYKNQIKMPIATTSAFFRVHADIQGGGTNQLNFPVENGISPNGEAPFTGTIIDGTNVMRWTGGVRVQ